MEKSILRGDVYYADLDPVTGSEQGGFRPVLVIQNNLGNKHSPTIVVAAVTSKTSEKTMLPTHYPVSSDSGLNVNSLVLLEQIRTIDKKRLEQYVTTLDQEEMKGIDRALAVSIFAGNRF